MMSVCAFAQAWAYDFKAGDLYYTITSNTEPYSVWVTADNKFSINKYMGLTAITIPETVTYNGITYTVTAIDSYAFAYCRDITEITIPNTVTAIFDRAFNVCDNLTSMSISKNVIQIGNDVFNNCSKLTAINVDPENKNYSSINGVLYDKGQTVLIKCPHNKEGVVDIPSTVTSMADQALYDCNELTEINVDAENTHYTSIDGILYNKDISQIILCPARKTGSITIPETVSSIGDYAFTYCNGLTDVTIPNSVTSIGNSAFYLCSFDNIVIPNSVNHIGSNAFAWNANLTNIEIPNSVTSISSGLFQGCTKLNNIVIASTITTIESYAFAETTSLTSIDIPNSVTEIGYGAFQKCSGLTNIVLPENITNIKGLFYKCSNLESITIPESVTVIESSSFYGCTSLSEITIPSSVTEIEGHAFYGCTSLSEITIPSSVTSLSQYAFLKCTSLTEINVDAENSNYASVDGVLYNKEKTLLIHCPSGKEGSVIIPNSVTSIGASAFEECKKLTHVELPEGITNIDHIAFRYCYNLTGISIPSSVVEIGSEAFHYCRSITDVTIPASTTKIGWQAFGDCTSLTNITIDPNNSEYVSSDGIVYNSDMTRLIRYPAGKVGDFVVPNTVICIADCAFSGCKGLSSIEIPASVTDIGEGNNAFYGCTGLTSFNVNALNSSYSSVDGVLYTKDKTHLLQCPARKTGDFVIPGSVTSIGKGAFYECTYLSSIEIPSTVNNIDYWSFNNCCENIIVNWDIPLTVDRNVFLTYDDDMNEVFPNATIFVPVGTKEKYETYSIWKIFNIVENDKVAASTNTLFNTKKTQHTIKTIKNGKIVIIKDGDIYDLNGRRL